MSKLSDMVKDNNRMLKEIISMLGNDTNIVEDLQELLDSKGFFTMADKNKVFEKSNVSSSKFYSEIRKMNLTKARKDGEIIWMIKGTKLRKDMSKLTRKINSILKSKPKLYANDLESLETKFPEFTIAEIHEEYNRIKNS